MALTSFEGYFFYGIVFFFLSLSTNSRFKTEFQTHEESKIVRIIGKRLNFEVKESKIERIHGDKAIL